MSATGHYALRCLHCGKSYDPTLERYTCEACGDRLGTLEVVFNWKRQKPRVYPEKPGLEKWIEFLPVDPALFFRELPVGDTPLVPAPRLSDRYQVQEVWVKDDGKNPTASLKDRASAVAISRARQFGKKHVFAASTGNAASSLAGLCAPAGIKAHLFVPEKAPRAKIAQLLVFGAEVFSVQGSYDQAFDLSLQKGFAQGWYCRNSAINPFLLEGKKSVALEIAWQMGWAVPDLVLVSVGDGTVFSSVIKGFEDLRECGLVQRVPVVVGVQAQGANAVLRAFEAGEPFGVQDVADAHSLADSIAVGKPRDVLKACTYARRNGGFFVSVSDEQIGNAIVELARSTGIFAEPAGAACLAGLQELQQQGKLPRSSRVVLINTGNGLKDFSAAHPFVQEKPVPLSPLAEEKKG
ncbi:MAG TPA: threonine synthase [Thermotogota bacterium]|nr:threonine synthase [Thermotogota bacterium]HRW91692.1 threonine synthase [Thermotogota bacterium]